MARNMRRFYEMFKIGADRMEYYYALMETKPEKMEGIVGYVFNDTDPDLRIAIEVDPEYLHAQNSLFPMLYVDPENYKQECRIILNTKMGNDLYAAAPEVLFSIWHEVGHFHTLAENFEEYLTYSSRKDQGYTAEQYLSIVNGEVLAYEAEADDFALEYLGVDAAVIALNGMISRVKKHPQMMNDRGLIKDLLNRKKRMVDKAGKKKAQD